MFCRVLGLLVLPTVGAWRLMLALVRVLLLMYGAPLPPAVPLAPGFSAGEGVVDGVRFVWYWWRCWCGCLSLWLSLVGCGLGRGWSLGVAGRGLSPPLAEGLVGGAAGGLTCCPSGVSGGPCSSPGGGLLGSLCFPVLCAFVVRAVLALLCVVCVCGARVGGGRGGVCCVRAGVCVVHWLCVWVPVLASLGLGWRLCVGAGAVCRGPSPALAVAPASWIPATPGWGLLVVVCSPAAPFVCPPPSFSWPRRLARCFPGALPGSSGGCGGCMVGLGRGWGGSLTLAPSPGVSPFGGRCLHSPSGCNSVVQAVHLYPLGTN